MQLRSHNVEREGAEIEAVFHLSRVATDPRCITLTGTIVECDTRMAGRLQSF
jgi:hypothetical protein